MHFLLALAQGVPSLLALGDDAAGWVEKYNDPRLVTHRVQGKVDVNAMVFGPAHLHVVVGRIAARGAPDGLTQLLLDFPGIGPPVGFIERLTQNIFRLQASRRQSGPVSLNQNALRRHQSDEHGRPKSIDEIAQALLAPLRYLLQLCALSAVRVHFVCVQTPDPSHDPRSTAPGLYCPTESDYPAPCIRPRRIDPSSTPAHCRRDRRIQR